MCKTLLLTVTPEDFADARSYGSGNPLASAAVRCEGVVGARVECGTLLLFVAGPRDFFSHEVGPFRLNEEAEYLLSAFRSGFVCSPTTLVLKEVP